jgi:hypothetical protein
MALANLGWQINTFFNSKLASMLLDKYFLRLIKTTGATSGAGTAYPSGSPEFIPGF